MVQVVAQQLARIGIRLDMRVVNYPTFLALRGRRKQVAFGPGFWPQDFPDAGSFLEPLFHSKSINDEDSNNSSFYSNPRVDELVDRARHELDAERRKKIYGEAQEIICDEAPWAFTHYYRFYAQWHPYVRDYKPHPMATTDPTRAWLDRAAGPVAARAVFSGDVSPSCRRRQPARRAARAARDDRAARAPARLGRLRRLGDGDARVRREPRAALGRGAHGRRPAGAAAGRRAHPAASSASIGRFRCSTAVPGSPRARRAGGAPEADKAHATCAALAAACISISARAPSSGRPVVDDPRGAHAADDRPRVRRGARAGAARRHRGRARRGAEEDRGRSPRRRASLLGMSAPTFVIGLFLQWLFAHRLGLLPLDGWGDTCRSTSRASSFPALTLGVFGAAYYTRIVRDEMIGSSGRTTSAPRARRACRDAPWSSATHSATRSCPS